MSSTTERQRGQVLAIFAISLVVLLGAGALAFDGGMMILERRDQQNAADAAAMAGARYVTSDHSKARTVAASVASDNGFSDGAGEQVVKVNVPPTSGKFASWPNAIQVEISNTRPSILGAVMGFLDWPVSASATAASMSSQGGPFSILSLEPSACAGVKVGGSGSIVAHGNVQVNSACPDSALKRQAGAVIHAVDGSACTVHGGIQNEGGDPAYLDCLIVTPAPVIPDPLASLPDVPMPSLPAAAVQEGGVSKKVPNGCPGSNSPATYDSPAACQFPSNYKDTTWRLYPGLYPGGLKLQGGNFYLEPGVYWLGGGGLEITGNGSFTISVDAGTTNEGGGVLFYNTAIPMADLGAMKLNGSSANIQIWPLDQPKSAWSSSWNGLVIYQDRDYNFSGDDLTINGNASLGMNVRGTIYVPAGEVKVNGDEGDLVMDQVITKFFDATGNGGDILALRDEDNIYQFTAAGLVE